jgi:hypothetical protein
LEAGNSPKLQNQKRLVLDDLKTPDGFGEGSPTEVFEFPVVSFRDIAVVTNNFDKSFMIGQGGFGKVYKVTYLL